ncbi:hypothetical protein V3W47_08590 [Deinococcus sp. YIM 134068]|uniref:hypothetical protein n=1 Tax=Deinococcus lichenicola TaxID=3118910 RepID=UPI002F948280
MLHGSLIGQVTSAPQVLTSPGGLVFSLDVGDSVLDVLVTHELANKARRQVVPECHVFVQVGHVHGGLLVASAFDLVMPGTPSLNMFNVSGRVSGWPEERQGELRVRLSVEAADLPSTLALTAPQHLPWLGSLQLEHGVQVIGKLRHVDGTLVIAATRVERLLST